MAVVVSAVVAPLWAQGVDCDSNGVPDEQDLCNGAADADDDGYLDRCEFSYGNFDLDGEVAGSDLGAMMTQWGLTGAVMSDLDGNGFVGAGDLTVLMSRWGPVDYIGPGGGTGPRWATVLDWYADPTLVSSPELRSAICATHLPWRVRDTATNIEMLLVPSGTFGMGCSASASHGCNANESPVHQVTITQAFYIGRYEVTQAQWTARMRWNPSYHQGTAYPNSLARPVEQVSWDEAQEFMAATGMRLPTEAEWEYAYRAGTSTAFHSGPKFASGTNSDSLVTEIAWCSANSGTQTHVVGGKAANALGLHDMAGNVWEWVMDRYGDYPADAQVDPTGAATGWFRVLRGGGWGNGSVNLRASFRHNNFSTSWFSGVGFRVARNPD